MKELLTVRANMFSIPADNESVILQAEIVILMSEPVYKFDAAGAVISEREISQCRFCVNAKNLRKLGDCFTSLANEVESAIEEKGTK